MGIIQNRLFPRRYMLICFQSLFLIFSHALHADLQTEVVHLRTEYRLKPPCLDGLLARLALIGHGY